MVSAASAKRWATATAVGGGGLGLLGGTVYGVLRLEGRLARRTIGNADGPAPDPSGLYGALLPGPPLRLAVLGDSAAAGYGARISAETFGAYLATGLSTLAGRPVLLRCMAEVGAQTSDLMRQIAQVTPFNADVAAVIIGTNDITHRVRPAASIAALRTAVLRLRAGSAPGSLRVGGPEVVVGTCPDMGTLRPLAPPLRQVARRWSRSLAAAQTIATVQSGGHSVSLGSLLGPHFTAAPTELFGPDRFHPSPAGYRSCATAMLPTVASVIGALPDDGLEPAPYRGERVFALARAAVIAAENAGTEVSQVGPGVSGRPGTTRLARVLRRRRHAIPAVSTAAHDAPDALADSATAG
ncbi:MAG: SGNH/GDSL hydrolase family protein [Nocardioidaceae bacterium]